MQRPASRTADAPNQLRDEGGHTAVGDIYQVNAIGRLQGQTVENVFHYRVQADADQDAIILGLQTFFETNFFPSAIAIQTADYRWTGLRIQKIWPLPARVAVDIPEGVIGDLAENALPAEVAMVITKQSFLAGRANRGRSYICGISSQAVQPTTGLFGDATMILAATLAGQLYQLVPSSPAGGTMEPVIYHRTTHTTTTIVTAVARNVPRAQRRRQVGRGI